MMTKNAVNRIEGGEQIENLVLKVVSIKMMNDPNHNSRPRFKMIYSDGGREIMGILSQQLNLLVENKKMVEGDVVMITEYIRNSVGNSYLIIPMSLEVIQRMKHSLPPQLSQTSNSQTFYIPQQQSRESSCSRHQSYGQEMKQYSPYTLKSQHSYNNQQAQHQNQYHMHENNCSNQEHKYEHEQTPISSCEGSFPPSKLIHRDGIKSREGTPVAISALNPYLTHWMIMARVTSKTEMIYWSNAKGEGNLFSVSLLDACDSEIRGTFFKTEADRFFEWIKEDAVSGSNSMSSSIFQDETTCCSTGLYLFWRQNQIS